MSQKNVGIFRLDCQFSFFLIFGVFQVNLFKTSIVRFDSSVICPELPDGLSGGAVLGGPGLIYDEAVRTIFSMAAADEITLK